MTSLPAFVDARSDKALRGNPMTIYLPLLDRLHPVEWKEVPLLAFCAELDLSESTVVRALNTLVQHGYLEREVAALAPNHCRRYRLVYSRANKSAPAHGALNGG